MSPLCHGDGGNATRTKSTQANRDQHQVVATTESNVMSLFITMTWPKQSSGQASGRG